MTDKEIIQAFEGYKDYPDNDITRSCEKTVLLKKAYLLMRRQQEEVELLKINNERMTTEIFKMAMNKAVADKVRAEAIESFAEKLKEDIRYRIDATGDFELYEVFQDIDNLVKEMVGADNG